MRNVIGSLNTGGQDFDRKPSALGFCQKASSVSAVDKGPPLTQVSSTTLSTFM